MVWLFSLVWCSPHAHRVDASEGREHVLRKEKQVSNRALFCGQSVLHLVQENML